MRAIPTLGSAVQERITGQAGEVVGMGLDWVAVRTRDMEWQRWYVCRWYDAVVPHHCLTCGAIHGSRHDPACDKPEMCFGMGSEEL